MKFWAIQRKESYTTSMDLKDWNKWVNKEEMVEWVIYLTCFSEEEEKTEDQSRNHKWNQQFHKLKLISTRLITVDQYRSKSIKPKFVLIVLEREDQKLKLVLSVKDMVWLLKWFNLDLECILKAKPTVINAKEKEK